MESRFASIFLAVLTLSLALSSARAATVAETQPAEVESETASLVIPPFQPLNSHDPFAEGRWSLQIYGSGTYSSGDDRVYGGHVGIGYHILDGVSLNADLGGNFLTMDDSNNPPATGGDSFGGTLDLLVRWHFLRGDGWSIFAEGGCGLMESAESFPAAGTHFNFRPQFGMGVTLKITPEVHLMGGARLLHISNAGINADSGHNPGYDSGMFYLGLMFPF